MGDGTPLERLNILLATQDDPIYVRPFFAEFLRAYLPLEEIKGIVLSRPMGRPLPQLMRQTYDFYGPIGFLRLGTRYASLRALDLLSKPLGLCGPSIEGLCRACGIAVLRIDDLNAPQSLATFRAKGIDLIVSVASPCIFKKGLLELPRHGCFNIHHGPLPRYRGMMPNFWQLYHGERHVGLTIHLMAERLDAGPIILQRRIEVRPGETLDALIKRTKAIGARCLVEAIGLLKSGRLEPQGNDPSQGSYFSFPGREHSRQFRLRGGRLL